MIAIDGLSRSAPEFSRKVRLGRALPMDRPDGQARRRRDDEQIRPNDRDDRQRGPSEIASWFFPHEPQEDELRNALRTAIEGLLDRRVAEIVGIAELARNGARPARSIDRAWRNYLEAMTAGYGFDYRDLRSAFFGGALSALLAINESLETADYSERPKLGARMRELTLQLNEFARELARRRD
jgi:hypothetical protein